MTFTCATKAKLERRFTAAIARLSATHPAEAKALHNILGALHGGYIRGSQLTLAHRLVRLAA